ncbi:M16 family metallopeptidase [Membranihabitans marinus]|uniref:M16 family metallopeptidase n=1 Tax=Membranihabitans marinus TaxID=1227546 RepID=UPI001F336A75|nr:pitrilysin family protein [Membranihabitans marinus]
MVNFKRFELDNGLKVVLHKDEDSTLVAVNVLYNIGSKNEDPEMTGITHLFEHMMFTGTQLVPDIDDLLQNAGGENNAFTNADYTNYYSYAPVNNLGLLMAIEADRMFQLQLTKEKFKIQKNVVIEEFFETCLNQPYGDVWHLLSGMAYKNHHYQWPTIGKNPEHIKNIDLKDLIKFYDYYCPNNAILSIGGNIDYDEVEAEVRRLFGAVPAKEFSKNLPQTEPVQIGNRSQTVHRNVPTPALYIGFAMPERSHIDYYILDMLTDYFAEGEGSFLWKRLVKKEQIFSYIDTWVVGSADPGLLVIEGKLSEGMRFDTAIEQVKKAVSDSIRELSDREIGKIKNRIRTNLIQSRTNILSKTISLAFFEMLGDIDLINREEEIYRSISKSDMVNCAIKYLDFNRCNTLIYDVNPQMADVSPTINPD